MILYAVIYRLPKQGITGDIYESEDLAKMMAEAVSDSWNCDPLMIQVEVDLG